MRITRFKFPANQKDLIFYIYIYIYIYIAKSEKAKERREIAEGKAVRKSGIDKVGRQRQIQR